MLLPCGISQAGRSFCSEGTCYRFPESLLCLCVHAKPFPIPLPSCTSGTPGQRSSLVFSHPQGWATPLVYDPFLLYTRREWRASGGRASPLLCSCGTFLACPVTAETSFHDRLSPADSEPHEDWRYVLGILASSSPAASGACNRCLWHHLKGFWRVSSGTQIQRFCIYR